MTPTLQRAKPRLVDNQQNAVKPATAAGVVAAGRHHDAQKLLVARRDEYRARAVGPPTQSSRVRHR